MAQRKATIKLPFTGGSPAYRAFRERLMAIGAPIYYPEPSRHSPYAHLWTCRAFDGGRRYAPEYCSCGAPTMPVAQAA